VKLEIEITEEEIRSAVERKVRTAIADQTHNWGVDIYIKDQVKKRWKDSVDALILEGLNNSVALQDKIRIEIERKLRAKITSLLKESTK
jgi:hypothetical protein